MHWQALKRVILTAGWAPALVFALHVVLSQVVDAYTMFPAIDIPMHLLGGYVMAHFVKRCIEIVPTGGLADGIWRAASVFVVVTATATAAVFWEFAEYIADQLLPLNGQLGLEDTLLDMALGIVGAVALVFIDGWRGVSRVDRSPQSRS